MDSVIDPELLKILVCPETKEPLRIADAELLTSLNSAVLRGTVATRGGETVKDPVEAGLVRDDGQVLYPVREGIPIMLFDESIDLGQF